MHFNLQELDQVDSTNRVVKEALAAGMPEGLVVRAVAQSGGYGRQGRTWASPPGGLYQSMLLRPEVSPEALPTLGLVVALVMKEVLDQTLALAGVVSEEAFSGGIRVKWPNDVMAGDAKMVGISCEARDGGLCVGCGVNVFRPSRAVVPQGKNHPAYLEDAAGREPLQRAGGIAGVGERFLAAFAQTYPCWQTKGFSAFVEDYNRCEFLSGRKVGLASVTGAVLARGRAMGIDEQGRLLVQTEQGDVRSCTSGEAHVL